ncbi:MAG: hypothetical protein HONBIEJF_00800 [Fimbriimonadaceae bacterium]|nr:hypothetical protein [Fimbriimonadaceae bacterium]
MWCATLVFGLAPLELAKPFLVKASGEPISVEVGHAAPNLYDWNGDGKIDLLVGQFGSGKLRVYLNKGSRTAPKFEDFFYVKAGHADLSVPAG